MQLKQYQLMAILLAALAGLSSCGQSALVGSTYVDSLTRAYRLPSLVADNNAEMAFWQKRIDPHNPQFTNESHYAGALLQHFKTFGDIADAERADLLYQEINRTYNHRLASNFAGMAASAILRHRFAQAGSYLDSAQKLGMETYHYNSLAFDVNFELGHYQAAAYHLAQLKPFRDYNYYFRRSKFDHYRGKADSALAAISKALELSRNSYLRDLSFAGQADLYAHQGDLKKAAAAYKQSIRINSADFHSVLGLGYIALIHDHEAIQAERLFRFALGKNHLPDPLFRLYQAAQAAGDSKKELQYAHDFAALAGDSRYEQMYNKYLIELYSGVLRNPVKAVALARAELHNRSTPQTYAWLAYALSCNGSRAEAGAIYQQYIKGRPLEPLELYYTGQVLRALGKGYDAGQYFEAAGKNKFDLSPAMGRFLEEMPEL